MVLLNSYKNKKLNSVSDLQPIQVALVFGGNGIRAGMGFRKNVFYISRQQYDILKADKNLTDFPAIASCWADDIYYSSKDEHNGCSYHYKTVSGLDLLKIGKLLGVDFPENIFVKSADGLAGSLVLDAERYAYVSEEPLSVVNPILAVFVNHNQRKNITDGEFPLPAVQPLKGLPTFMFGQRQSAENTNCQFVKNIYKVIYDDDESVLAVGNDRQMTITLADIVALGVYETEGDFSADGEIHSAPLIGIPLRKILQKLDIPYNNKTCFQAVAADGQSVDLQGAEVDNCFVVWDSESHFFLKQTSALALYLPHRESEQAVLYNFNMLRLPDMEKPRSEKTVYCGGGKKREYVFGDKITDAVFYLAVKDERRKLHYFYYTMDDIKVYAKQTAYTYVNHSITETATVIGAPLTEMLKDLPLAVNEDWVIQYAEIDGYHAEPQKAAAHSEFKDKVADLLVPSNKNGDSEPSRKTTIAYEVNMRYQTPQTDKNNRDDPAGVFKHFADGSLLRAYRRTASAGSTVIKYLIGVCISPNGDLLQGNAGCVVNSRSAVNTDVDLIEPIVVKGLLDGMNWAVKAPVLPNSVLSVQKQQSGYDAGAESLPVTAKTNPQAAAVNFYFDESPYFTAVKGMQSFEYTYSDFVLMSKEIPKASDFAGYEYYGYNKPMYVRYKGVWLHELLGKKQVRLTDCDGRSFVLSADEAAGCFLAYCSIQSKKSTNIANYKRVTRTYKMPLLLMPFSAPVEFSCEHSDYESGSGKLPEIVMKDVVSAETEV